MYCFFFFFYYLFLFLLTINFKLITLHVEIKIVNKEAATKRSTLLHAQQHHHGRRTFEQSDVMLIRKGKRKEVINTHIRAIVRECCVIMDGRNN